MLVWKEWREQSGVVAAGAGMALALPLFVLAGMKVAGNRPLDATGIADLLTGLYAGIVWPVAALAAGAATFAHEAGDGTLAYLLARPMSRARIWSMKVLAGAAAALTVVLISLLIAWAAGGMAGGSGLGAEVRRLTDDGLGGFVAISFVLILVLMFCTSVLFSVLISRPLTAAAGGLAAASGMAGLLALFWWRLDIAPRLEPGLAILQLLILSAAALGASLIIARRVEAPAGAGPREAVLGGLILLAAGMLSVAIAVLPLGRMAPEISAMWTAVPTPSGNGLVVTAPERRGYAVRTWLIHADGAGVEPLTPRLTFSPMVSPDGVWAAYVSLRGPLGLRARHGQLRLVSLDGSEDRLLAGGLPLVLPDHIGTPVFSRDGERVAVMAGSMLVAASVHDGEMWRGTEEGRARLLGWTADGTEVLVISSSQLVAVHAGAGRRRVLKEGVDLRTPFWWHPPSGIDRIPVESGGAWALVDARTGAERPLAATPCGGFDQSRDGEVVALADCPAGEIRLRVNDDVWGSWPGRSARIRLSPSSDRAAVQVMEGPGVMSPVRILGPSGVHATFEAGWSALGWWGRDRVLLMHEADHRLAVGDTDGGRLDVVFPL
jgi:hypothetical protein